MSRSRPISAGAVILALCALLLTAARADAQPTLAAPSVLAGPSADIGALGGMSIARDGSGGLVFSEQVAGVPHVFVSRLQGGVFQTPQQVDATLPGPSSQPVIAAANGGLLLVAFINGGQLYVVDAASAAAPLGAPLALFAGAANPAISITTLGKAYIAFTAAGAGGHDVRAAYYYAGQWALEPTALDAAPGDDAGVGTGRPAVAAAGDGVAIVAWGENGHIYTRRVWGTSPSVVYQQADPATVGGFQEVSADEPSIGSSGDSSYADVAFHETVASGDLTQERVLMSRLVAGQYQPVVGADGLGTPGSDGAVTPQVMESEYGRGFVLSARENARQLWALNLGTNGGPTGVVRVDSLPNLGAPFAAAGTAGLYTSLIAWQQQSVLGTPEIHVRYGTSGGMLGPEQVASSASFGPTDAASGLDAAGDAAGDGALAWVQGVGPAAQIVTAQLYQPPGAFSASAKSAYADSAYPTFSWSAAKETWGPVQYRVAVDGITIGATTATLLRSPVALTDGPHSWQVTAVNQGGVATAANPASVFVDTLAPLVRAQLTGRRTVGSPVHLLITATDLRPGEPAADSSGIIRRTVKWGDGTSSTIVRSKYHVYHRAGLFKLTVTVADRAGNVTTVVHYVRIARASARRTHGARAVFRAGRR